jgi:hypothetical protein
VIKSILELDAAYSFSILSKLAMKDEEESNG